MMDTDGVEDHGPRLQSRLAGLAAMDHDEPVLVYMVPRCHSYQTAYSNQKFNNKNCFYSKFRSRRKHTTLSFRSSTQPCWHMKNGKFFMIAG